MKLSLRRAHKLRKAIEARLSVAAVATSLTVDALSTRIPAAEAVSKAQDKIFADLRTAEKLSEILVNLRCEISRINHANKVDELLAQSANVARLITLYKKAMTQQGEVDAGDVEEHVARFRKIAETPESISLHSRYAKHVDVRLIGEEETQKLTAKLAELHRQADRLEEKRLAANAAAEIEIAPATETFLLEQNLI